MTKYNTQHLVLLAAALLVGCQPVEASDDDDDQSSVSTGEGGSGGSGGSGAGATGGAGGSGAGGAAPADLGDVQFSIWRDIAEPVWSSQTGSYHTNVTVCINSGGDFGNFVTVSNTGSSPINAPFEMAIGVWNDNDESYVVAADRLTSDLYMAPGDELQWEGPFCTSVTADHQASDTVRLFVFADSGYQLNESDELNNAGVASESLPLF